MRNKNQTLWFELLFFHHSKQKLPNKDITWELLNTFNYTLITWSFCFVKTFTASKQIYERRRNENFREHEMFCAEPHLATRATLIREHAHTQHTHTLKSANHNAIQMHVANEKRQEIAYDQGHVSRKSRNFGRISGATILFVSSKRWRGTKLLWIYY